jgi:hypothetical protein
MSKEEKATPAPAAKKPDQAAAYILTFENSPDLVGVRRIVNWVHGHGVLDRKALAAVRSDLCDQSTLELKAGWPVLEELARYWKDHGATVKKVTELEAEAYRKKLYADPRGHLPKEKVTPAKKEEGAKGKKSAAEKDAPPHKRKE